MPPPLPPAQPAYILRGHSTPVHAVHFTPHNRRLITGDAAGWLISWNLATKRPVAVWQAHANPILGLASLGPDHLISHGRDHRLVVWKLGVGEEEGLDRVLPVEGAAGGNRKPEVVHSLDVNTLNFCSFAWCWDDRAVAPSTELQRTNTSHAPLRDILIAVPNSLDSNGIDIYHLPSSKRLSTIPADQTTKTGMVMALHIHIHRTPPPPSLRLIAGYESGHTTVYAQTSPSPSTPWHKLYSAHPHSQPILSLAPHPTHTSYLTTSADALIVSHPLPSLPAPSSSFPTMATTPLHQHPTSHAGQQGLSIRSDGLVFATAGWDGRARVYSCKTLAELAVLKWHKEGCFATVFAEVGAGRGGEGGDGGNGGEEGDAGQKWGEETIAGDGVGSEVVGLAAGGMTVAQRREVKAQTTHWLAVGSKDGKVSLWDIY